MEDISTAIARPCAVRLGDVMCNDSRTMARSGCKLSAEKENLLSAPRNKPNQGFCGTAALLSPGDNIGDDGSIPVLNYHYRVWFLFVCYKLFYLKNEFFSLLGDSAVDYSSNETETNIL